MCVIFVSNLPALCNGSFIILHFNCARLSLARQRHREMWLVCIRNPPWKSRVTTNLSTYTYSPGEKSISICNVSSNRGNCRDSSDCVFFVWRYQGVQYCQTIVRCNNIRRPTVDDNVEGFCKYTLLLRGRFVSLQNKETRSSWRIPNSETRVFRRVEIHESCNHVLCCKLITRELINNT